MSGLKRFFALRKSPDESARVFFWSVVYVIAGMAWLLSGLALMAAPSAAIAWIEGITNAGP